MTGSCSKLGENLSARVPASRERSFLYLARTNNVITDGDPIRTVLLLRSSGTEGTMPPGKSEFHARESGATWEARLSPGTKQIQRSECKIITYFAGNAAPFYNPLTITVKPPGIKNVNPIGINKKWGMGTERNI